VQLKNWGFESPKKSATIFAHCFNSVGYPTYLQGLGVNIIFLDIVIRSLVGKGKVRKVTFFYVD
jgi:hypothetical protein